MLQSTMIVSLFGITCFFDKPTIQLYTYLDYKTLLSCSYDCDDFTKNFYKLNFGIKEFQPIQITQPQAPSVEQVLLYDLEAYCYV